jgi:hypothetical protein
MRKRGIGTTTAALIGAALMLAVSACGGSSKPAAKGLNGTDTPVTPMSATPATPTGASGSPTAPGTMSEDSSARLAPALMTLDELPSGFRTRPLTLRNLPSLIHGCPGLEELQQTGIADQAQAEWTRGAFDAYLDEAVIQPRNDTAAALVEKTAKALDACGSVKVVEEGLSVTLTATPLPLAKVGDASHAWHTTGKLGLPMEMNVVLIQQGDLAVLVAQTHVGGATDDALTLVAAQAAAKRAADFQKKH